jgi:4-hydroxyphenylacetate 3-monooxygenase
MSYQENGEACSVWFQPPRSKDDLRHRAEAHRRVAQWSCGLMGRSMDHVPSFIAGMSMKPELFDANRVGFGQNVIDYLDYLRKGDLFACYLVLTPQTSRGVAGPAKANFRIVGEYES